MALGGLVLLLVALSSAYLRNLPISTSAIYLALGVAIGPLGFGWLRIDLRETGPWFERLTEVAVIVALFVGGLKLRLPLRHPAWVAAYRLAGPLIPMSAAVLSSCATARIAVPSFERRRNRSKPSISTKVAINVPTCCSVWTRLWPC